MLLGQTSGRLVCILPGLFADFSPQVSLPCNLYYSLLFSRALLFRSTVTFKHRNRWQIFHLVNASAITASLLQSAACSGLLWCIMHSSVHEHSQHSAPSYSASSTQFTWGRRRDAWAHFTFDSVTVWITGRGGCCCQRSIRFVKRTQSGCAITKFTGCHG